MGRWEGESSGKVREGEVGKVGSGKVGRRK